ncbi:MULTISPECIES: fimbria/pilus outer membrane usher protein [Mixta]|uniref:fimbria/pilus outer membrane usher protein n=1 Tax=Mixta TaxID=2100764 RepID=UPI000ED48DE0|nr:MULTISPECIES: fimbria/pilus outer membrane usher protein [Mixta]MBS6059774.1 fimbrial biogenesis outer membrane usher protein [Pantoea sp.]MCR1566120.1 fimbrial biogenesis outer membrane usher protein [Mixta sp.]MDU5191170.1 fimbria/pilus outer membrane usher protein [Mixta calida]HCW47135.1 export and assembly usher protein of type 1 fimbriae [Erwiniaceae bacterium]
MAKKASSASWHGRFPLHAPAGSAALLAAVPAALFMLCHYRPARAEDYFDPAALELSDPYQKTADLHYFAKAGGQQPGDYLVTVLVNNQEMEQRNVTFVEENGRLQPVLTVAQLAEYGVNVSAFSSFGKLHEGETLTRIDQYIPDASSQFDFTGLRLYLSIPQAAMNTPGRDYVDPARWNDGIPAAFINYSLSGSQTRQAESDTTTNYLNLRSGVNLGGWRLRNISSMTWDKTRRWQSQSTWLQCDVKALKSQLRIGDIYTPGDIFTSVQFRGVQLASQDEMLPDSMRGFAPVIRGMAHSNAKVTVSQHGYVIYETYVPPGAFAIKDLNPTAQSGDLQVKVQESNGAVQTFTQPYSAVPFMLREGRLKFSLSAGRYHSGVEQTRTPQFVQTSLYYGLPWAFTLSGGAQLAENYQAYAFGVGHGFGELGSIGLDATLAATEAPSHRHYSGHSLRAQYQKDINLTGTTFSLASYRYSSSGYYEFGEANALESRSGLVNNKRSRKEIAVSQSLGDIGSLTASFYSQQYWHAEGHDETVHLGLYSGWKGISWGVGYYLTKSSDRHKKDRSISFNISVPLNRWLPDHTISYNTLSASNGYSSQQVSLYGTLLDKHNLYYSVQQGYDSQGQGHNGGASLDYHGGYGTAQLGYRHDSLSRQITWGASGSVVAHPHGVTLGQPTDDTFAIVRAPGASHVAIQNGNNIHTDWRGYAVVPTLTPYRKNYITLDTETLADDTDVELEGQTVIPGGGAVVQANYRTHIGNRVLFTLKNKEGPLPFGTSARLLVYSEEEGAPASGMVADGGQVYLSGIPDRGAIEARWQSSNVTRKCVMHFRLPNNQRQSPVKTVSGLCL